MVYDVDNLNTKNHPTLNEDYDLILDPLGYIVGFDKVEEEAKQYLYVKDSDEELSDWVAKVVLPDGTTPKVDVKSKYKVTGSSDKAIAWVSNKDDGNTAYSNIDNLIWKYTATDAGVYTLTQVADQGLLEGAEIHNGKAYITDGANNFIVDKKTIFVDVENNKSYTGYSEVPDVDNAEIAYVLKNKVVEVAFILSGTVYDKDSTYFVLSKTTRESLKYDGSNYWEYTNAYINGDKQTITVKYDALNGGSALAAGVLYKGVKTNDQGYYTEIQAVNTVVPSTVNAVADGAFWLTTTQSSVVKFDCDDETVFVLVEQDKDGKYTISEGNINDLKDRDGYTTTAMVVEKDDEYAELVYILAVENGQQVVEKNEYSDYLTTKTSMTTNGRLTVRYTVDRPEYIDATAAALNYSFEIWVDGQYLDTVKTGVAGYNAIAVNNDSASGVYTDSNFLGTETVEIKNFKFTDLTAQTYIVKIIDQNGDDISTYLTHKVNNLRVKGDGTTSGPKLGGFTNATGGTYKVTQVVGADVTVSLPSADTAYGSNVGLTKVTPDGDDYVTVVVDTSKLELNTTRTIALPSADTVQSFASTTLSNAIDGGDTLTFTASPASGESGYTSVISAALTNGPATVYGYQIDVTIDGHNETLSGILTYTNKSVNLGTVTVTDNIAAADVHVSVTEITAPAVSVTSGKAAVTANNNVYTITFDRNVKASTVSVTAGDSTQNGSGTATAAASATVSGNKMTVISATKLVAGEKIVIAIGSVEDSAVTGNTNKVAITLTLQPDGSWVAS
jgi:hypothetical protein